MDIGRLYRDREALERRYADFMKRGLLVKQRRRENLVSAHLSKAAHDLRLADELRTLFNDWRVVAIYYSLYHLCLALLAHKGYASKNHTATLVCLMWHYAGFEEGDVRMVEDLRLKEHEAMFYAELKHERHKANYATGMRCSDEEGKGIGMLRSASETRWWLLSVDESIVRAS